MTAQMGAPFSRSVVVRTSTSPSLKMPVISTGGNFPICRLAAATPFLSTILTVCSDPAGFVIANVHVPMNGATTEDFTATLCASASAPVSSSKPATAPRHSRYGIILRLLQRDAALEFMRLATALDYLDTLDRRW